MNIKFPTVILALILAMGLIGCSSPNAVSPEPSGVTDVKPLEPVSTVVEIEKPALTVEALLAAFPECEERDTFYEDTPYGITASWGGVGNMIGLHIDPSGQNIKSAQVDIYLGYGHGSVEKATDKQLEPLKRFLCTLFPDWEDSLTWLRETFSKMQPTRKNYNLQDKIPYEETRENWELRVSESEDESFLMIAATQGLGTRKTQVTTATADTGPRDFEKLVAMNGQSVVKGASVEDDNGKALTRASSKYLAIWVSPTWHQFTDTEKKYFIKIHVDAFNEWKGDDEGVVIVFDDYLKEELGGGTSSGITLKK